MMPDRGGFINFLPYLLSLATEMWFIRTIGTTALSYATRMMYRSYLHNKKKQLSQNDIEKKSKGIVVMSHLLWSLILTYTSRREAILDGSIFKVWDLFLIEFFIFLAGSLFCYTLWEKGLAPYSDKKFGTTFIRKRRLP